MPKENVQYGIPQQVIEALGIKGKPKQVIIQFNADDVAEAQVETVIKLPNGKWDRIMQTIILGETLRDSDQGPRDDPADKNPK